MRVIVSRLREFASLAFDNLFWGLCAGPGIRQVLRRALWGWPVSRRRLPTAYCLLPTASQGYTRA